MKFNKVRKLHVAAALGLGTLITLPVLANHSWSNYHWQKGSGEVRVKVGDNVSPIWDGHLSTAILDWDRSTVLQPVYAAGESNPKNCKPVAGTIQVCNSTYGKTGWLGIAQIWLSGDHITQGVTKLNDTYFNTAQYNTPSWRQLVTCQEIGHDFGLGHQDENFSTDNTASCMDYTSVPAGNEHPDQHDYDQLLAIYNHSESATATSGQIASEAAVGHTPAEWGKPIRFTADGRPHVFERVIAPGRRVITHVFWAIGEGPKAHH